MMVPQPPDEGRELIDGEDFMGEDEDNELSDDETK